MIRTRTEKSCYGKASSFSLTLKINCRGGAWAKLCVHHGSIKTDYGRIRSWTDEGRNKRNHLESLPKGANLIPGLADRARLLVDSVLNLPVNGISPSSALI